MFLSWHHKCVIYIYIKNNFKNCIKHKYTTLPLRNIKGITKGIVIIELSVYFIKILEKILFINIESPMNCDMIYDFYSVSCEFSLSPSLGEGIENTQEVR